MVIVQLLDNVWVIVIGAAASRAKLLVAANRDAVAQMATTSLRIFMIVSSLLGDES
jgi:hypothetical protein